MDLEEWEFLSDDGFIDHLQTQQGNLKRPISRDDLALYSNSTIDMDYFQKYSDPQKKNNNNKTDQREAPPNLLIPVPVELDLPTPESPKPDDPVVIQFQGEKETFSPQVFFKKTGENEFADMKLDSPESGNKGVFPQIDGAAEDEKNPKEDAFDCGGKTTESDEKEWEDGSNNNGGLKLWKMGMTGVGALCSFGFACATICVIALGSRHTDTPRDHNLHFQIYADDKRIKQVVHHASKLNEAISAVRGAQISRAHITIGGYFEGL